MPNPGREESVEILHRSGDMAKVIIDIAKVILIKAWEILTP